MANKVNINKEASKASIEKLRSAANLSIDAIDYAVHVADAYTDLKSFSNFFEGHAKIKDALVYLSSMVEGDANALDLCVDNMFTLDKDMGAGWIYDSKTEYKSGKDYDIDKTKSEDLKTESRAEYKVTKATLAVSEFAIGWVAGDAAFDIAGAALKPVFKVAMKTPAGKTAAKVLGNAATKVKGKAFGLSEKALTKLAAKTKSPILKKLSEAFGGKATFLEAGALVRSKITTKVGSTKLGAKILGGESKIGAKSAVTEVRNKIFGKTEAKAASTGGKILKGTGSHADELGKGIKTIDKAEDVSKGVKGVKTADRVADTEKGIKGIDEARAAERAGSEARTASHTASEARAAEHAGSEARTASHTASEARTTEHAASEARTASHTTSEARAAEHTASETRTASHTANETRAAEHAGSEAKTAEHAGSDVRNAETAGKEAAESAGKDAGQFDSYKGHEQKFKDEQAYKDSVNELKGETEVPRHESPEDYEARRKSVDELRDETEAPRHKTYEQYKEEMAAKAEHPQASEPTRVVENETSATQIHDEEYMRRREALDKELGGDGPARHPDYETWKANRDSVEGLKGETEVPGHQSTVEQPRVSERPVTKAEPETDFNYNRSSVNGVDDVPNYDYAPRAQGSGGRMIFDDSVLVDGKIPQELIDREMRARGLPKDGTIEIYSRTEFEQKLARSRQMMDAPDIPATAERSVVHTDFKKIDDLEDYYKGLSDVEYRHDGAYKVDYEVKLNPDGSHYVEKISTKLDAPPSEDAMRLKLPDDPNDFSSVPDFEYKNRPFTPTENTPPSPEPVRFVDNPYQPNEIENAGILKIQPDDISSHVDDFSGAEQPNVYERRPVTKFDGDNTTDFGYNRSSGNNVEDALNFKYENKPSTPVEDVSSPYEPVQVADDSYVIHDDRVPNFDYDNVRDVNKVGTQPVEIKDSPKIINKADDVASVDNASSVASEVNDVAHPEVNSHKATIDEGFSTKESSLPNDIFGETPHRTTIDDSITQEKSSLPNDIFGETPHRTTIDDGITQEKSSLPNDIFGETPHRTTIDDGITQEKSSLPNDIFGETPHRTTIDDGITQEKSSLPDDIFGETPHRTTIDDGITQEKSSLPNDIFGDTPHRTTIDDGITQEKSSLPNDIFGETPHRTTIDDGIPQEKSSLPDDIFGDTPHRATIDDGIPQEKSSLPDDIFGETPHRTTIDDGIPQEKSSLPDDIFGETPHKTTIADNTDDALDINRTISHADETPSVVNNVDDIPPSEVHHEIEKPNITDDFADEVTTSKPVAEEMPSANNPVNETPHSQVTDDFLDDASLTPHDSVTPDRPSSSVSSPAEEFADTLEDAVPENVHDGNLKTGDEFLDDELERAVPDKIHNEEYRANDDLFPDEPSNSVHSSANIDVDNHSASPLQTHAPDTSNTLDDALFPDEDIAPTKSHADVNKPIDVKNPPESEQALPSDIFGETSHYNNDYVPLEDVTGGKSVPETIVNENGTTLRYNGHTQKYEGIYQGEKVEVQVDDILKNKDYVPDEFTNDKGIKIVKQGTNNYSAVDVKTNRVVDEFPWSKAKEEYDALAKTNRVAPDTFRHEASGDTFVLDKNDNSYLRYHNGETVDKISSYDAERLYNAQFPNQAPDHFIEPERSVAYNLMEDGKYYEVTFADGRVQTVPTAEIDTYFNENSRLFETNLADPDKYLDHNYINAEKERKKAELEEYLANGGLPLVF